EIAENFGYSFSQSSLKLWGDTWKIKPIDEVKLNANEVWSVAINSPENSNIKGFGITDGYNCLLYSLGGQLLLDIEQWVTAYQDNHSYDEWHNFHLPVSDDWLARFDYLPVINGLIFINDQFGTTFFDYVCNHTEDLLAEPIVNINYEILEEIDKPQNSLASVMFNCTIFNQICNEFQYNWILGDGSFSSDSSFVHEYSLNSSGRFKVILEVVNDSGKIGRDFLTLDLSEESYYEPIRMNFVGDVMLARGYNSLISYQGAEILFSSVVNILKEEDLNIANLESPLTDAIFHHPSKPIFFKGNPENVEALTIGNIDIVTLANNHIMDYMLPGLQETQSVLEQNGILFSGVGKDSYEAEQPLFYSKNGIVTAFLASSDRTGQYNNYKPYLDAGYNKPGFAYMTPYKIREQLGKVDPVSDLRIVEFHAGSEYSFMPGAGYDKGIFEEFPEDEEYSSRVDVPHMWDLEIRRFAIDEGADLVICHHPHIIQGFEVYNGKVIAHSLGNFVFDLSYAETMPSMILSVDATREGFKDYTIHPVFIDNDIPIPAKGKLGNHIIDYLVRRSLELDTWLLVNREIPYAKIIIDPDTLSYNKEQHRISVSLHNDNQNNRISESIPIQKRGYVMSVKNEGDEDQMFVRFGREVLWFGHFEDDGVWFWETSQSQVIDFEEAHTGLSSLQLNDSHDYMNISRPIKCFDNGAQYSLTGFYKTNQNCNINFLLDCRQSRTYPGVSISLSKLLQTTNEWEQFDFNLGNISDNTNFFDLFFDIEPTANAIINIDDLSLIEWSEWMPVAEAHEIVYPNDYSFIQIKSLQDIDSASILYTDLIPGEKNSWFVQTFEQTPEIINKVSSYPNPFIRNYSKNNSVKIAFNSIRKERVKVEIFNLKGQIVNTIADEYFNSGKNTVEWNTRNKFSEEVSSGIYFYRISAGNKSIIGKTMIIR
ncbi:MAG: CapA family protein, partial [Candidatus Cloacimonetes bacterium]|nr:CapA family protein [Candidatus Cloacimonadota bacterium]